MAGQSRLWAAICYVENMIDDWQDKIDDLIEFEYCYIIHDQDLIHDPDAVIMDSEGNPLVAVDKEGNTFEIRKIHVHLMLNWTNTTTSKAVLEWVNAKLSKPGKRCCSTVQKVGNPIKMWKYLIHDTPQARKEGKHQYPAEARITGNGFDIERYQQVSLLDKRKKADELSKMIIRERITNYVVFYNRVMELDDDLAKDVIYGYSGHFEKMCKGAYLMVRQENERQLLRKRQQLLIQAGKCTDAAERFRIQQFADSGVDPETGEIFETNPFSIEELIEKEREKERLYQEEKDNGKIGND